MARTDPRHLLVVSDVHLADVAPPGTPATWYRRLENGCDSALASVIRRAVESARGSSLQIVFNGDVFDFDAPSASSVDAFVPNTTHEESGASACIARILSDHAEVAGAMRSAISSGARVVFVAGNHDAQLAFHGVKDALRRALGDVEFASVGCHTGVGLYVEHGHHYDPLCTLHDPAPEPSSGMLEETVGSVVSYHAPHISRCVDPYADDPFATSWREIARAFVSCAVDVPAPQRRVALAHLARALACVAAGGEPERRRLLAHRVAQELRHVPSITSQHVSLFSPKRAADYLAEPGALGSYAAAVRRAQLESSRAIALLYRCRGVVMGHTHAPFARTESGVFLANCGSWAPSPQAAKARAVGQFVWAVDGPDGLRAGLFQASGDGSVSPMGGA